MDDSLMLALLLSSQKSTVSDEDCRDIFRDKEFKAEVLRAIVVIFIVATVFLSLYAIFDAPLLISLLLLLPGGYAALLLPFAIYYYLKCVIIQWLKL